MRATVSRKALAASLKHVTPVIAKGGSLPVLGGVRIESTSAGLDLCCSNLALTSTSLVVDAIDVDAGVAIPPAQQLQRIVDKLGGENVRLELDENVLTITSGETVATVRTWSPDEWPKLRPTEGESVLWSETDVDALARILPMASVDENRPLITGVYFGKGDAAATDSYRLGVVHDLPDTGVEVIIPASALKIILAEGGGCEVTFDQQQVTVVSGTRTITARLYEGEYPNWRGLIPKSYPFSLTFASAELRSAFDRAGLAAVSDPKSKSSRVVRLERDGDKARVWADDADTGVSVSDTIGCRGDFEGRVGWQPDYLADLLDAAQADEVTVELADSLKPSVVRTGRLTLLVMPVRLPS